MAKPTVVPSWATGANAAITEPPAGKKSLGFQVAEPPAAQHLNWLFKYLCQWADWTNLFESTEHAWSTLQTFAAGISITGAQVHTDARGDTSAQLQLDGPITVRKLRLLLPGVSSTTKTRVYTRADSGLEITSNCYWDGTDWHRDEIGGAHMLRITADGLQVLSAPADPFQPWLDGAWLLSFGNADGYLKFDNVGSQANPDYNAAGMRNKLCALNIPKAFGSIKLGSVPVVEDGFGIASVNRTAGGQLRVVLTEAMANTKWSPQLFRGNVQNVLPSWTNKLAGEVTFNFWLSGTGLVDITTMDGSVVEFFAYGRQNDS